jgi:hypothetical protein
MECEQGFSLVIGGPLFQLMMRGRIADSALHFARRRIVAAILLLWVPLLVFSLLQALWQPDFLPLFVRNVGVHLRFLVVVPVLLASEIIVHHRLRPLADQFRVRRLLRPEQEGPFDAAIDEAVALRNSIWAELAMLAIAYGIGVPVTARRFALQAGIWYSDGPVSAGALSFAGWWLVLVSLPIFQFLLCRWYFRLFIWARFLWRVSRLDLALDATHPDHAGGLGFLGASLNAFMPLAFAHGVLLAGVIADRILFAGAALFEFKLQLGLAVILLLLLFAGPLAVFTPLLARTRRKGLMGYGALAQAYVQAFEAKWRRGGAPHGEELLGSADIQSLADFANSYAVVEKMRLLPVSRTAAVQFIGAILLPVVPLLFTVMSPEQLLGFAAGMLV